MVRKILFADRSELRQGLEEACFRRRDFRLLPAATGEQAQEIIEREHPDLVLLESSSGGAECCLWIKSDPRLCAIPVILVSPDGSEESLALCRQAGCDEMVTLPIDGQRLFDLTRRLLKIVQRQSLRYGGSLQILYGPAPHLLCQGQTLNLGTGGVLIEADRLLAVDTLVYLEIRLPAAKLIRCRSRVAWVNPARRERSPRLPDEMGLQFLDMRPEDKSAIRDYIEREVLSPSS